MPKEKIQKKGHPDRLIFDYPRFKGFLRGRALLASCSDALELTSLCAQPRSITLRSASSTSPMVRTAGLVFFSRLGATEKRKPLSGESEECLSRYLDRRVAELRIKMSIEGKPKVSEMEQAVFAPFAKTKGVNKIWVSKENELPY